jgi:hypothetical protein
MTQVELETLIRQVPWPIPSRDLRMRVLAAGQTTSRAVLWSDRIWFSRGWRSAGAIAAIVAIAVGFWNSTGQRTTLVPPVAQASAEAVADVGRTLGVPAELSALLVSRTLTPPAAFPSAPLNRTADALEAGDSR